MSAFSDAAAELNSAVVGEYGIEAEHTPSVSSAPSTVTVVRRDPLELSAGGVLMSLFGTMADSGFPLMPVKNDTFIVAGISYRAFEVQGPDESGGITINLTK